MEPNFHALQLISEVALGILGFSAILIGLSRTSDGFSDPDDFRIQLLSYSALGAMFGGILPFAVFNIQNLELSWTIVCWLLCLYSAGGLLIFPRKMISLRVQGHENIFPIKLCLFQTGIISLNFTISGLMIIDFLPTLSNIYVVCLILFLLQSTVAFIRTMFVRVH